jgi:hypothetical protein
MISAAEKFEILFHELRNHYKDFPDLQALVKSTEDLKQAFNLPKELHLKWFNIAHWDLYHTSIDSTLSNIREMITSNEVIIIWLVGYHMPLNEFIISKLNEFSQSLSNPILYCTGALGPWIDEPTNIYFTISKLRFYEYESSLHSIRTSSCYRSNLSSISNSIKKPNKFMFIGTKDYPNRKYLLSQIITNNLHTQGLVSYKQVNSLELTLGPYTALEINHIEQIANIADQYLPLPYLDDSIEYVEMPRKFLLESYVNVVTDTYFDCSVGTTFVSEKVFNAIANWQMFIMMAPAHTLRYLKSCGYKTFSPYIDESYDEMENNYQRIIAVTNSVVEFLKKPIEEIQEIYTECTPIIEHNKQLLLNCNIPNQLLFDINRAIAQKPS